MVSGIIVVMRRAFQVPLFWMAIVALSGIAVADGHLWWAIFALIVIIPFIIKKCWGLVLALVVTWLVFAGLHQHKIDSINEFPLAAAIAEGDQIQVRGKGWISSDSRQKNPDRFRATLTLDQLMVRETLIPLVNTHRVVVEIQHNQLKQAAIGYGNELEFSGRISRIEPAASPGAFDPAEYYFRSAKAIAQLQISPGDKCQVSNRKNRGNWLRQRAIASRQWMEGALSFGITENDQSLNGVVQAMVLGSREKSPEEIEEWFRLSGTMHIFAVSGLHVGVIALLLWWLLKWTGLSRISAVYLIIPAVLFYAVLTGLRPSSFRAAVMLSVFLAGFAFRQRSSPLNALGVAALILVALDTQQVFLPGFQLSFCVVLSLILAATVLTDWLHAPFRIDEFLPRRRIRYWRLGADKVVRFFAGAAAISLASWVGSFLLMDSHFNGISPIGLVANIFMVPIAAAIVTISGIALACYGIKLSFLTFILNQVNITLVTALTAMAQFFSGLPGAHVHTGDQQATLSSAANSTVLNIMGIDGEHASLLSTKDRHWMIDSGGNRTFTRQVLPVLRSRGINHLEGVLLSHGDAGHIGATPYILDHLTPRLIVESQFPNRARVYKDVESLARLHAIERLKVKAPQRIALDKELYFEVLYPTSDEPPTGLADDCCLVIRMRSGHWRILFTFDSGFLVEKAMINQRWNLKSDIWIRGQHGKTRSATVEFLDRVSPKLIITSESDFPAHERLHRNWLDLVEKRNIDLISLKQAGSVEIVVDGRTLKVTPYKNSAAELKFSK